MAAITILKQDGPGSIPARRWAEATMSHIIDIAAEADSTTLKEARDFEAQGIEILERHHQNVQDGEKDRLAANREHCDTPLGSGPHLDSVDRCMQELNAAASTCSFAGEFASEHNQTLLAQTLCSHFATSAKIERQLHADENPDNACAVAFKKTTQLTGWSPMVDAPPEPPANPPAEPATDQGSI